MALHLSDCEIIEGLEEATDSEYYAAIQSAINGGIAWKFQGSYGRVMMDAINAGRCILGLKPAYDAYGNRIPSRDEVQPGTRGSPEFAAKKYGREWLDVLECV